VFADGCAASLVSAEPRGLAIDSFLAVSIPATSHLITWRIGELGFDMHLSGQVPGEIGAALKEVGLEVTRGAIPSPSISGPFIPAGRSILDSVEKGLALPTGCTGFFPAAFCCIWQHVFGHGHVRAEGNHAAGSKCSARVCHVFWTRLNR